MAAPFVGAAWGGEFSERYELTRQRVLLGGPPSYTPEFLLADLIPRPVRRFTEFSGDLSGRYIGALAASGERDALAGLLARALAEQKPDGHFGGPAHLGDVDEKTMALFWGQGRLLIGLMEAYEAKPSEKLLGATRRLGDFLVDSAPVMNSAAVHDRAQEWWIAQGYICWTQNLEGVVALWRATHDDRYLQLAGQLAERIEQLPGMHSHGLLTSLRGLAALHEATGEARWLTATEAAWERLAGSDDLWVHGSIPEALAPGSNRDEGCSIADWVRLNLELWQVTRNPRYIEHAEHAIFNAFFGNQFPSGDFGHVELRPDGFGYETARAWWCCTLHGLRAFPAIRRAVFRVGGDGVYYDLPLDGEIRGEGWSLRASAELAEERKIRLEASGSVPALHIRVPAWAESVDAGTDPAKQAGAGYLTIAPASGETVLRYTFRTRELRDSRHPGEVALLCGPWLLSVAERDQPFYFDEPAEHNRVQLPAEPAAFRAAGRFRAPAAYRQLRWIPAGYTTQPQTAILRPVSEFTAAAGSARRQVWLPVEGEGGKISRALARLPPPARLPWTWIAVGLAALVGAFWLGRRRSHK